MMEMSWTNVMLVERDAVELDKMKYALEEMDEPVHCMSFMYADEVMPALTNELKHIPDFIFIDVEMPRKSITDLLAELCPLKIVHPCKIIVFGTVMPRRVAYAYRVMGANYAFQKPVTKEGYREIFSRILGKEIPTTIAEDR